MFGHVSFVIASQQRKLFPVLEREIITGDEVKTPVRELYRVVSLKNKK